jgi:hypothetical protein
MGDLLSRLKRPASVLEHSLHYDAGMVDEQLGASARPMRSGRHGLLWDPVSHMPPVARGMLRGRIIPVATAAFDGTTADFWAQHWSGEQLDRLDVLHVAVDGTGTPVGWVSGRRAGWGGGRVFYAA